MEASGRDAKSMNDLFSDGVEPMTGVSASGDADDDLFSYGDDKERLKDRSGMYKAKRSAASSGDMGMDAKEKRRVTFEENRRKDTSD
eukprot:11259138-Karenia_brevis.AAC.1